MTTPLTTTARVFALVIFLALLVYSVPPALAHGEPIAALVSVRPAEPVPNEEVELRVTLLGAQSNLAILGAELTVIADMSIHKMKPVSATLSLGVKPNEHVGKLRFTMVGAWEVTLDMLHEGERTQARFNLEVKEPTAERDEGIATHRLSLELLHKDPGYPGSVLIGTIVLIVLVVGAAWIRKKSRKARQCSSR